jgi:hypothetical protein
MARGYTDITCYTCGKNKRITCSLSRASAGLCDSCYHKHDGAVQHVTAWLDVPPITPGVQERGPVEHPVRVATIGKAKKRTK